MSTRVGPERWTMDAESLVLYAEVYTFVGLKIRRVSVENVNATAADTVWRAVWAQT